MWQAPIDDLLKVDRPHGTPVPNFNPFEILEPQKVNINNNILVDISTNDKPVKNTDPKLEMGSFIDTVTKKEYNLVDLYQNIYVTPQHVKRTAPRRTDNESLIDFSDFFDHLESGCIKTNKSTVTDRHKTTQSKPPNNDNILLNKNEVLLKKSTSDNHMISNRGTPIHSNNDIPQSSEGNIGKSKKDYRTEFLKHYQRHDDTMRLKILQETKNANSSTNKCSECQKTKLQNLINVKRPVDHNEMKSPLANMIYKNQFDLRVNPAQLLQTAVKDQKLYSKQHSTSEDYSKLTKGPDIYEKSRVLPQIMERLAARKMTLDAQKTIERSRRLVLEKGEQSRVQLEEAAASNILDNIPLKTEVLMQDCNKSRLIDLKVRTSFEKFVKTGQFI
ncbi:unnamed protein product [Leptosia nina]|uniref:Uncharacterized protein n=1 Tax=Leptosia nina TaxID=320188 RepID=A0AAV1JZQ7_9NEOP